MANHKLYADAMFQYNWEGGLSRALTDTASSNPCPVSFNGKTGWHTNKGVTWTTFVSLAPALGYSPTADNFFAMPRSIWDKIYKHGYWNPFGLDQMKSESMAAVIVSWAWGSGVQGATNRLESFMKSKYNYQGGRSRLPIRDFIDNLVKTHNENEIFHSFCDERARQFRAMNQAANLQGWLNRLARFRTHFDPKKKVEEFLHSSSSSSLSSLIERLQSVLYDLKTLKCE
jgi:lysozyme family protein